MKQGTFVISLDFELLWGQLDQPNKEVYKQNVLGGRKAIPKILDMFDKHQIHATWATVGMLMLEKKIELKDYIPSSKPLFKNTACSAYTHLEEVGDNEDIAPCFWGNSLVKNILKYRFQEIGTHTFSHYYCQEEGADVASFSCDLKAAQKTAKEKFGIELKSIVFPRNHVDQSFVETAVKEGIVCWRGNAKGYEKKNDIISIYWMKILRLLDTYLPLFGHLTTEPERQGKIVCLKASRFLRPYNKNLSFLEPLKLRRIKQQMRFAAKHNTVFHLWWHPHNFGVYTEEMLCQLEEILCYYDFLKDKYNMCSLNMGELQQKLI